MKVWPLDGLIKLIFRYADSRAYHSGQSVTLGKRNWRSREVVNRPGWRKVYSRPSHVAFLQGKGGFGGWLAGDWHRMCKWHTDTQGVDWACNHLVFFFFLSTAMGVYALTAERWWETTVQNRVDISTAWCPMNCTIPTGRHLSMRLSYELHWNTSVPKAWDTELHRKRSSDLRLGLQEFFFFFFPQTCFQSSGIQVRMGSAAGCHSFLYFPTSRDLYHVNAQSESPREEYSGESFQPAIVSKHILISPAMPSGICLEYDGPGWPQGWCSPVPSQS